LHGQPCTAPQDCVLGTSCRNVPGWPRDTAMCMQYCETDAHCYGNGEGSLCLFHQGGKDKHFACSQSCDPVSGSVGCPTGTMCTLWGDTGGTVCLGFGASEEQGTCSIHENCGPGLMCREGRCEQTCIVGDDNPCLNGTSCDGPAVVGQTVTYGSCR
jgi:hypothetical protein